MPLLPRSARPAEQQAATARVRGLLPALGGWVPPREPEPAGADESVPVVDGPGPQEQGVEGPAADPAPVTGVLDALRAGRLDPGRRAVWGLAVVALLACLVAGALVLRGRPHEVAPPAVERAGTAIAGSTLPSAAGSATPDAGSTAGAGAEVVVAVAGRVRRPGLVRLAAGSRVDDALRAAGGLLPGTSPGLLNLARRLVDGEQVLVGVDAPAGAEASVGAGGAAGDAGVPAAGAGPVDLNTAGVAELDALPGIGPVLAQRIVDHRTKNGPFRSVDQLREVSGIGEAKYALLKDAVRV